MPASSSSCTVAGGGKGLPIEAVQMGMDRVGTTCRTTSSDVNSSSRQTRPLQAGTGRRDVGADGLGLCLARRRCGGGSLIIPSTHQIPCSNKKLSLPPLRPSPSCPHCQPDRSFAKAVLLSCEPAGQCNVSAHDVSPHFPLYMPEAANRLVIATAGQRHRPADSHSECNGPNRPVQSISSHRQAHHSVGGGKLCISRSCSISQIHNQ